jgi:hypothetical protein
MRADEKFALSPSVVTSAYLIVDRSCCSMQSKLASVSTEYNPKRIETELTPSKTTACKVNPRAHAFKEQLLLERSLECAADRC